jgi:UDP-N-acetylglucosamine:LPS N-acetylglucosamine transferase
LPVIDFIYFDAGGGHRSAANALKAVIEQRQKPWTVRLVNLQEILDSLDIFRKITRIRLQDLYNLLLAKGWTLGSAQMLAAMHAIIRMYHRPTVRLLREHWRETKPDLVVSLVPNFNRAMYEALRQANPRTPYLTILTDFADYPPHFWMERQDQYVICGTQRAAEQAAAMGYRPERIFRVSGMILRPKFYEPIDVDRRAQRGRLGLDPDLPTGLVLFGGQGSRVMIEIADRLGNTPARLQLILICGRNNGLAERLRRMTTENPKHVEGFTAEVPYFMSLSDFFIGKPGPGSISEAVAMGLPAIVEKNLWTLPQERFNADWVRQNNVGIVLENFRGIAAAVEQLLAPGNLEAAKERAAAIHNRAVYEIPDILDGIVEESR